MDSFGEYARRWLRSRAPHVTAGTQVRYALYLRRHVLPVLGLDPLATIRPADVLALADLLLEQGLAPGTVRAVLTCTGALFERAIQEERVTRNPVRGLLRRYRARTGRALTPAHEAAFVRALDHHPHGDVLLVLLRTGLRLGEALGLQWADVDFEHASLHVSRQWGEGGLLNRVKWDSARVVDLTRGTVDQLARMRRRDPCWVFVNPAREVPWCQRVIEDAFREVAKAAGLPAGVYTPHSARHTYATRLLEVTGDVRYVQQQLGHRSVKTTVDLYARTARRARPASLDLLDGDRHPPRSAVRPGGGKVRGIRP